MGRTKKVGTTGRFGPRYGRKPKLILAKIEKEQKKKHQCPSCKKYSLKRVVSGIWFCKKCELKMAGGAYTPRVE